MTEPLTTRQAVEFIKPRVHHRTVHKWIVKKNSPFPNAFRRGHQWFIPMSDIEEFNKTRS